MTFLLEELAPQHRCPMSVGLRFFNAYDRLFAFRTHLEIHEEVYAVRILGDNVISHS